MRPDQGAGSRVGRGRTALAFLCVLALAASGCGSDDSSDDPTGHLGAAATGAPLHPDEPLDDEQLATVLVKVEELGPDYAEDKERSPRTSDDCLHELLHVDNFGLVEPESDDDAEFFGTKPDNDAETIISAVASYQNETAASSTYDDFYAHVQKCKHVEFTQDKRRWALDIEHDRDLSVAADNQVNLHIEGTMKWKKQTFEVRGKYSFVRSQNDVVTLALIAVDPSREPAAIIDPLLVRSANRLLDLNE